MYFASKPILFLFKPPEMDNVIFQQTGRNKIFMNYSIKLYFILFKLW